MFLHKKNIKLNNSHLKLKTNTCKKIFKLNLNNKYFYKSLKLKKYNIYINLIQGKIIKVSSIESIILYFNKLLQKLKINVIFTYNKYYKSISKRPTDSRMGGGKGSITDWIIIFKKNTTLFKIKYPLTTTILNLNNLIYICKKIIKKLNINACILLK